MYFAARTLAQKFGQTFGVLIFAMMTTFGKDIGNDTGIRLSGVVGFILCFLAGVIFLRYQEGQVLSEIRTMEGKSS
jgi:GPH family glycoside/pentoside/hexuronide:cation symporter